MNDQIKNTPPIPYRDGFKLRLEILKIIDRASDYHQTDITNDIIEFLNNHSQAHVPIMAYLECIGIRMINNSLTYVDMDEALAINFTLTPATATLYLQSQEAPTLEERLSFFLAFEEAAIDALLELLGHDIHSAEDRHKILASVLRSQKKSQHPKPHYLFHEHEPELVMEYLAFLELDLAKTRLAHRISQLTSHESLLAIEEGIHQIVAKGV